MLGRVEGAVTGQRSKERLILKSGTQVAHSTLTMRVFMQAFLLMRTERPQVRMAAFPKLSTLTGRHATRTQQQPVPGLRNRSEGVSTCGLLTILKLLAIS